MQVKKRKIKSIWEDDTHTERLLHIACKHVKLALEHGAKDTLPERRKAIVEEIERLREERNALIKHQ